MNTRVRWLIVGIAELTVSVSMGQSPVIKSIQGTGQLSWTNAVNANAIYRAEWASRAGGPWHKFTYQPINTVDAGSNTQFAIDVPMFYRVVMHTNQPPVGMVWIDGGDVELGQGGIAAPVHTNFVSGFWMDITEVTKAQWDDAYNWAITNGYAFDNAGLGKTNDHPVHTLSWYDCVKWCNARSQKEGRNPCYYLDETTSSFAIYKTGNVNLSNEWVKWNSGGYRLPTEAEWEKAARGGHQRRLFPWGGDTIQHAQANYNATNDINYPYDISPTQGYHPNYQTGGEPYTSPAGSFPANGYGLHDMAGNLHEWCWDNSGSYSASYQIDPHGPAVFSGTRTLRDSSWRDLAAFAICANRAFATVPQLEAYTYGFRCAKGP